MIKNKKKEWEHPKRVIYRTSCLSLMSLSSSSKDIVLSQRCICSTGPNIRKREYFSWQRDGNGTWECRFIAVMHTHGRPLFLRYTIGIMELVLHITKAFWYTFKIRNEWENTIHTQPYIAWQKHGLYMCDVTGAMHTYWAAFIRSI